MVLAYLGWGMLHPTIPGATAGSLYPRTGVSTVFMAIPLILGALRVRKYDDPGSPALYVIPAFLAFGLLVAGILAGYLPDDPDGCGAIDNPRDFPDCFTTPEMRTRALIEIVLVWVAFGLFSLVLGWWKVRRRARREATG